MKKVFAGVVRKVQGFTEAREFRSPWFISETRGIEWIFGLGPAYEMLGLLDGIEVASFGVQILKLSSCLVGLFAAWQIFFKN